jgi:hypothetical protein
MLPACGPARSEHHLCADIAFPIAALHDNDVTSCWLVARDGHDADRYLMDGHDAADPAVGLLSLADTHFGFRQIAVPDRHGPVRITTVRGDLVCLTSVDGARASYDVRTRAFHRPVSPACPP